MLNPRIPVENSYRLVVSADRHGALRVIEFHARGRESALLAAERHCAGSKAEVFENGRSLGMLQNVSDGGFWVITQPQSQPS